VVKENGKKNAEIPGQTFLSRFKFGLLHLFIVWVFH